MERFKQAFSRPGSMTAALNYYRAIIDAADVGNADNQEVRYIVQHLIRRRPAWPFCPYVCCLRKAGHAL